MRKIVTRKIPAAEITVALTNPSTGREYICKNIDSTIKYTDILNVKILKHYADRNIYNFSATPFFKSVTPWEGDEGNENLAVEDFSVGNSYLLRDLEGFGKHISFNKNNIIIFPHVDFRSILAVSTWISSIPMEILPKTIINVKLNAKINNKTLEYAEISFFRLAIRQIEHLINICVFVCTNENNDVDLLKKAIGGTLYVDTWRGLQVDNKFFLELSNIK